MIKDRSILPSPEYLTPPAEAQLDALSLQSSTDPSELNPNPISIGKATVISNEPGDERFEVMIDDIGKSQINQSSKLDFGSIATFAGKFLC